MSYGQYNQNPYQQGPAQESGYGYGQGNPYAQDQAQGQNQYEMQDYNNYQQPPPQQPSATLSLHDFLGRVQELRHKIDKDLDNKITEIGKLHKQSLNSADGGSSQGLNDAINAAHDLNTQIRDGIKGLERDLVNTTDSTRNTKKTQLDSLRTFFQSALSKFQSQERQHQNNCRRQIARQYQIVNPEASEEEAQEAAQLDWGNEGVFQTALRTNNTANARSALGNVRARHSEIHRIEQTITEISYLYQELATLVEQQEPVIQSAENNAVNTVENIEKGNEQVKQANEHARRRRKLKWWCALVVLLIILAIGLGVGLGVALTKN